MYVLFSRVNDTLRVNIILFFPPLLFSKSTQPVSIIQAMIAHIL